MPPSKREELIESAVQVFGQHGFQGTSLDDLLEASGLSRMTLYNHFKSKDELIVAVLRRRDEEFRNNLMKRVERASDDPINQIRAIFDEVGSFMSQDEFHGCMFINAAAEYYDPDGPMRRASADHKIAIIQYIEKLCKDAGLQDSHEVAQRLGLLLDGAMVNAQIIGSVHNNPTSPEQVAKRAKEMSEIIIESART
jgi:AcrR family transcriptional regulator